MQVPLLVAEAFADALGLKSNPVALRAQYVNLLPHQYGSVDELNKYLDEVGNSAGVSFMRFDVDERRLVELLEVSAFPALVMVQGNANHVVFLRKLKRGRILCTPIGTENATEQALPVQELITLLHGMMAPGEPVRNARFLYLNAVPHQSLVSRDPAEAEDHIYGGHESQSHGPDNAGHHHAHPSPFRRLMHLLALERKDIGYIYIYAIAIGLLGLSLPLGLQAIVGLVSGGLILEPVIILMGFVIFGTLLTGVLQILQVAIVEVIQQRVFTRAAFEFAYRIPRIRMEAIRDQYAPELMNRFFDILTIQKGFAKILTDFITSLLQIIFGMVLLAFYHPFFVFFSIMLLAVIFMIFYITGPRGLRSSIEESKYKYKVAHWLEELARTLSTFKLAGFTNLSVEKMDTLVSGYLKKRKQHFKVLMWQYFAIVLFKALITAGVLIIGGVLVVNREISLGQFVAAEIVIITTLAAVEKLVLNLDVVYDLLTAVDKVGHVTDLPMDKTQGILLPETQDEHPLGFAIRTRHLSYTYPGGHKQVLQNIDLDIAAGDRVGIVGPIGSGKTTLMHVLTGLYEDFDGAVSYDGISLRDINVNSLRDHIGDNLTHEDVFDGTLAENIAVGKSSVTYNDILRAVRLVGLEDYVSSLPNGLNTHLVAGGKQLSAALVKKIILARSLAERPRLMVFDDFFAAFEPDYRRQAADLIFDPAERWTVLAVTNSPEILSRCNAIYVMEEGVMSFKGSYPELMTHPTYGRYMPPISHEVPPTTT